jgi:hypothetical protein
MNVERRIIGCGIGCLSAALLGVPAGAADSTAVLVERDLSGPRVGMTCRLGGPEVSHGVGRVVSQLGWHGETRVTPRNGGAQFVLEAVPLVAGVEYGKFYPSLSLGTGVRLRSGWEFGVGPTFSLGGSDAASLGLGSALFVAVGRTFDYSGISLPINLVLSGTKERQSLTLLLGYGIPRATHVAATEDTALGH